MLFRSKVWEEISREEDRRKVLGAFVYPMIGLCGLSLSLIHILTIFGNMFDWTVKLSTDKDDYYYALDATDYSLIKEHAYKDSRRSVPGLSFTCLLYTSPWFRRRKNESFGSCSQ